MGRRRYFTIQRDDRMEQTVVGIDGQTHVMDANQPGRDGHFTDEGQYRRAIEQAAAENRRLHQQNR